MTQPTICVKCRWHEESAVNHGYDRCLAPALQRAQKMDYVTGETQKATPRYCVENNTSGNCPHYEEKA